MIYIKHLKKNEEIKMRAAEILDDSHTVMLPHIILGEFCVMPMAKKLTKAQRPDPDAFIRLLQKWYCRTTDAYSEGIYSFARQGRTRRSQQMPYYQYLKQEIDALLARSDIHPEYASIVGQAQEMWEQGFSRYQNTQFMSYHYLHGDLHIGNIVRFRGQYRLIDWENLRSGPKEIELAFYLCWDHLRWDDYPQPLGCIVEEARRFGESRLINEYELERIFLCLIPLWMLLLGVYLNNGNLLYAEERKRVCESVIPRYRKEIYDVWIQDVIV